MVNWDFLKKSQLTMQTIYHSEWIIVNYSDVDLFMNGPGNFNFLKKLKFPEDHS